MIPYMIVAALMGCGSPAPAPKPAAPVEAPAPAPVEAAKPAVPAQHTALFQPLKSVPVAPTEKDLVELGRMLYHETRLSVRQNQSCNTCHVLSAYGVDNLPTSPGSRQELGKRNSPSSFGASGHFVQFWDGRSATLEEQAKGPILNPVEMGMKDEAAVLAMLESIPGYQEAFSRAFPTDSPAITYNNLAMAIGAFERHLVAPSRFDAYLEGDAAALTAEETKGLEAFISTGCIACHMGPHLGGQMFQKLGLVVPYPTADLGRFEVTGQEADKYVFKVPSLRNIAKTGPYFHDGSVTTLEDAVGLMAKHQLGKDLTGEQVADIVTFLNVLTGEIDRAYVAEPSLPPNGPKTPGPS